MFEDVKPGDKVWSIQDGWGRVLKVDTSAFPLIVQFTHRRETFTLDGKPYLTNINPTLFWGEIKIEAPKKPLPDLAVDTKVLVWDTVGGEKRRRHFKSFDEDGKIVCFLNGLTSWTSTGATSTWGYWEVVE